MGAGDAAAVYVAHGRTISTQNEPKWDLQ